MADEKELKIKLVYTQDANTLKQAEAGAAGIDKNLTAVEKSGKAASTSIQGVGKSADEAKRKINEMREQAERLQQVGMTIAGMGAAILTPMGLALNNYIQNAGEAEQTAKRWKEQTERLSAASQDVGAVIAEEALPYLEKAADLAEKAAKFAEDHPEAIKAAMTIGGTLAAAGTLVVGLAQIQRTITSLQALFGTGGMLSGAGGSLAAGAQGVGAFAASTTGAGVAGFGLGLAGYQALAKSDFGQSQGYADLGQYATVIAYGLGELTGKGNEWARAVGIWTGAIEDNQAALEQAASAAEKFSNSQMQTYINYIDAENKAKTQYEDKVAQVKQNAAAQDLQDAQDNARQQALSLRNFNLNEARISASLQRQNSQDIASFLKTDALSVKEHYANRLATAKAAGIEIQRMEEDHQREMRKLAADHQDNLADLATKRDALGIVREVRSYEKQRKEADSETNLAIARKKADTARTLAEQDASFAAQREQRLADFQAQMAERAEQAELQKAQRAEDFARQQADEQEAYAIRRQRQAAATRQQLADLAKEYNQQRVERRNAMISQLGDLTDVLTQERLLRQRFTSAMLSDLQVAVNQASKGQLPSRASGGYVSAGLYRMHNNEFVMNEAVTRAAERAAGGALSSDAMLSLIARGAGGAVSNSRSLQYNDNRRFGMVSAGDIRRAARVESGRAVTSFLKEVGSGVI